jgi:hypothetical protein
VNRRKSFETFEKMIAECPYLLGFLAMHLQSSIAYSFSGPRRFDKPASFPLSNAERGD